MTRREAALKEAGIDLHFVSEHGSVASALDFGGASFSGYGEFTPITVRSDTVLSDADLERNKFRN
ncbi:hypothetical protein [Neomesorhizobium albiziae]|nr:hypothetical protein [Mesorhizobium albiziae]GLS29984.1 hypothetical protein GCM10007937_16920 [Mesorhizobium albiziae]